MASAAGPSNPEPAPAAAAEGATGEEGAADKGPPAPQMQELENVTMDTLQEAQAHLDELLNRKKYVDRLLVNLESSIYAFEGSYLEDTAGTGNIIKGFDGYLTSRINPNAMRQKHKVNDADRLFSQSSTTYIKALEQKEKERMSMNMNVDPMAHMRQRPMPQEVIRPDALAASMKKKPKRPSDGPADIQRKR